MPFDQKQWMFLTLGLISLAIVVLKSDLAAYQQFYLRIFIGLSAAGIAAVIPGSFEIQIKWLDNGLRASGAIGVFLLIYTQNPPELSSTKTMEELKGEWYYSVHPVTEELGYGSKHYGGKANFSIERNDFGRHLSVTGIQEWRTVGSIIESAASSSGWQSISGGITSDDRLIYQYQAMDSNQQITGFCTYTYVRDKDGEIIRLVGTFHRVNSPHVQGDIFMNRKAPWYEGKNFESALDAGA